MDGSNPKVLINDGYIPEAIAIDLEQKNIYYSIQYPSNVMSNLLISLKKNVVNNFNVFITFLDKSHERYRYESPDINE